MKKIKLEITTTNQSFIFGIGWENKYRYAISFIFGCIVFRIYWYKKINSN